MGSFTSKRLHPLSLLVSTYTNVPPSGLGLLFHPLNEMDVPGRWLYGLIAIIVPDTLANFTSCQQPLSQMLIKCFVMHLG